MEGLTIIVTYSDFLRIYHETYKSAFCIHFFSQQLLLLSILKEILGKNKRIKDNDKSEKML